MLIQFTKIYSRMHQIKHKVKKMSYMIHYKKKVVFFLSKIKKQNKKKKKRGSFYLAKTKKIKGGNS